MTGFNQYHHKTRSNTRIDKGFVSDFTVVRGAVAGLVGIEGGVVSGVINLELPGVGTPGWRPRHDHCYYEA